MQVSNALIEHLSNLSRLHFEGEEKEAIRQDLQQMIGFIEQLQALDTTGVEPLRHLSFEINKLRNDEVKFACTKAEALQNAALHNDDFFLVPKVIVK